MTGEHDKEKAAAIAALVACGWREVSVNKKGYTYMMCSCGLHQMWLPKTPSNPNTFRRKAASGRSKCCP